METNEDKKALIRSNFEQIVNLCELVLTAESFNTTMLTIRNLAEDGLKLANEV